MTEAHYDAPPADQLRQLIERIERLEEEKAARSADIREVKAEAKGQGFDVAAINRILKIRKMDPDKRAEQVAVMALYLEAIGMPTDGEL